MSDSTKLQPSLVKPVNVFISYARSDEILYDQLRTHLTVLEQRNIINIRDESRGQTDFLLEIAQLSLLLVSPDFLHSGYLDKEEIQYALTLHESGGVRVLPIVLRPCNWKSTPLKLLPVLPREGRPVMSSRDTDEVFAEIAREIELVCVDIQNPSGSSLLQAREVSRDMEEPVPGAAFSMRGIEADIKEDKVLLESSIVREIYELHEVFIRSNVPGVTFVKYDKINLLKLALKEPNRGVVVEGPSGVGKTTAVIKALEELGLLIIDQPFLDAESDNLKDQPPGVVFLFSARNPLHRKKLETLRQWHKGTVIIDDFHHLEPQLRSTITDYLKDLADNRSPAKKLVLVGIPHTGQSLVNMAFDLATRIDVFKLGLVSNELVLRMIEQGEVALNIGFDRKSDIVLKSSGSLNIAQYLCRNICARQGIEATQVKMIEVSCDMIAEIETVMQDLARKFGDTIRYLAAGSGMRDWTGLKLLEELADSEKGGILSLPLLKVMKPELAHGIDRFINSKRMEKLYNDYPESKNYLFYNPVTHTLVIDDPQFSFYLQQLSFVDIAKEEGKFAAKTHNVFVSYSHKDDKKWLEMLKAYLRPNEHEGLIKVWSDEKIVASARWREEIQKEIESSTIAIMLVNQYFLGSEFISDYERPMILERADKGGTRIVSLITDYCQFKGSGLDEYQCINTPNKPLIAMTEAEQHKAMFDLAETVTELLQTTEQ